MHNFYFLHPSTAKNDSCACDYHGNAHTPNLPWLPKRVRFSGPDSYVQVQSAPTKAKNIPSLIPLTSMATGQIVTQTPSSVQSVAKGPPTNQNAGKSVSQGLSKNGAENIDAEAMQAQIRINTRMMAELETLRKDMDSVKKQRDFFKIRLSQTTDQLVYLKKKVGKKHVGVGDENQDPNKGGNAIAKNMDVTHGKKVIEATAGTDREKILETLDDNNQ